MKTRDEQAEEYVKALKEEFGYPELVDVYKAFQKGWDAALKSQWRDVREELPTDSIGKEFLIRVEYYDGSGFNHCSAAFIKGHWNILDDEILEDVDSGKCEVTHWMPIPDMP